MLKVVRGNNERKWASASGFWVLNELKVGVSERELKRQEVKEGKGDIVKTDTVGSVAGRALA